MLPAVEIMNTITLLISLAAHLLLNHYYREATLLIDILKKKKRATMITADSNGGPEFCIIAFCCH